MPYQFDTEEVEVISLLDSSEDEDDVLTPTSRRQDPPPGADSTPISIGLTEEEIPDESASDDSDDADGKARTTRSRLRSRIALNLEQEIEELDSLPAEIEATSESDSDEANIPKVPSSKVRQREAFKKLLGSMEDPDDIALLYPKSLHPTSSYPEDISDEREVLREFIPDELAADEDHDTFEELELYDFSLYRGISHDKGSNGQFESLHVVSSEKDDYIFYLDGVIHYGGEKRRIIGAIIDDVNIGGLNDTAIHTTLSQIWVRTDKSRRRHDCWYRLCLPSAEYNSTWIDFVWLADLNKHVLDYLYDAKSKAEKIRLQHFEAAFWTRLLEWHSEDHEFQTWSERCGRITDFRMHITTHTSFLRDQAWSIGDESSHDSHLLKHALWAEIGAGKFTEDQQSSSHYEQTVVTPNVGSAFTLAFPKWGPDQFNLLSPVPIAPEVAVHRDARRRRLGLPDKFSPHSSDKVVLDVALLLEKAATVNKPTTETAAELVSKVVIVRPSPSHSTSRDRRHEEDFRFALVHEVAKSSKAVRVIWLTLPSNACASQYDRSFYPITNELFYTDHCNCRPVPLNRIVGVHNAAAYPDASETTNSILIQLLYREEDAAFLTPRKVDVLCTCQSMAIEDVDYQPCLASTEDSQQQLRVLRNMSLFSGCGLLDYGMEEGGSGLIETVFAIDHNEMAMCTQAANRTSKDCTHVVGSVNVHLERFLRGEAPLPEIDCITAGCPCKGFSLLNAHRLNQKSQRNCSLLASVLSWIELFLPRLVLIENVPRMDFVPSDKELANASAQAICCLVAMGYQVKKVLLAAYEHGSPTLRRRLFIIAAAPGVPLPDTPQATHGGDDTELEPIVTVGDVLEDLKPIHNDKHVNISDPTHIPIQRLKLLIENAVSLRSVVKRVPKTPGFGLVQAHQRGLLSRDQKRWYYGLSDEKKDPKSKSLRRVDVDSPFKTIVTVISPLDCRFGGEIVHPYEDRLLSLKEIRRAQGVPDWFLLVGSLQNKVELVGNGVAWQVAAALGRSFADAWRTFHQTINDLDEGKHKSRRTEQILHLPQKTTVAFKETTKTADLPDADTIVVEAQPSASPQPSPSPEVESLSAAKNEWPKVIIKSPKPEPETIVSMPILDTRNKLKTEELTRVSSDRSNSRSRSRSEEVYEISDHENLVVTPNGTYNYHRSQRGKIIRRSSSAKKCIKPVPMVIIPTGHKRAASLAPAPPSMTQPKASDSAQKDESDSEIEYLETRPVAKKLRVTARVEDWYDD